MSHKKYRKSVFLFRRDLRLTDNTGLLEACENSQEVFLVFIFDPRQANPKQNAYFSERSFAFLVQSLKELSEAVSQAGGNLFVLTGKSNKVLWEFCRQEHVDAVFANADYTPFARKRDESIQKALSGLSIDFCLKDDYTLSPIIEIVTGEGKPYSVFTPFYKKAETFTVENPRRFSYRNMVSSGDKKTETIFTEPKVHGALTLKLHHAPGRTVALDLLKNLSSITNYPQSRNELAETGTSRLSPHIKFGTVSVREVYQEALERMPNSSVFISEIYWRDFYLHIAYNFPRVFGRSFLSWGDAITWRKAGEEFECWKEGKTGVPIVDAGMRELNATGWMHNRARMISASYLTKNLLIDWREGERYFANQLVDYDPASNNGGWQWSASVGADPRPLRIFNPYLQAKKYDPLARYIKRWVPELESVNSALLTDGKKRDFSEIAPDYFSPMVDYVFSYRRAIETYKAAKTQHQ